MNWDAIGAIGELLGAIVVIASILYLSRQLRESNKHASAEVERHAQESYNQYIDSLASDRQSLEVWRSGNGSFSGLSDVDKSIFHLKCSLFVNHLEMVLRMQSKALISSDMADTFGGIVVGMASTPGGREWWDQLPENTFQKLSTEYISQAIESGSDALQIEDGLSYFVKISENGTDNSANDT